MEKALKQISFFKLLARFRVFASMVEDAYTHAQSLRIEALQKQKWVLDTDCGVDDAQAVILTLLYLNPIAIIASTGNVERRHVAINVSKIMELCKKKAPIWLGSSLPMIQPWNDAKFWHGKDGLGDSELAAKIPGYQECIVGSLDDPSSLEGVTRLINLINKYPNQINIISIGLLSTLAYASVIDPSIPSKVKSVHIMGGAYLGQGNVPDRPTVEFNFGGDPEAARIVLQKFSRITLVPWEAIKLSGYFQVSKVGFLQQSEYPGCAFIKSITQDMLSKDPKFYICDMVTVALLIEPSAIKKASFYKGRVLTESPKRRGELVVEEVEHKQEANLFVIEEFDQEKVIKILEVALKKI